MPGIEISKMVLEIEDNKHILDIDELKELQHILNSLLPQQEPTQIRSKLKHFLNNLWSQKEPITIRPIIITSDAKIIDSNFFELTGIWCKKR